MGLPVAGWGALGTWVGGTSRNWVEVSEVEVQRILSKI